MIVSLNKVHVHGDGKSRVEKVSERRQVIDMISARDLIRWQKVARHRLRLKLSRCWLRLVLQFASIDAEQRNEETHGCIVMKTNRWGQRFGLRSGDTIWRSVIDWEVG